MNVATTHVTVVTATVRIMTHASALGSPAANRCGIVFMNTSEARNDTTIALISLHALIRHQYQRRMSTRPVPAPIASKNFHAFSTEESCDVTMIESRNSTTVATRPTFT